MSYDELLKKGIKKQGIKIDDIPFNIFLKDETVLPLCFLEEEDEEYLMVVVTNPEGCEELHIVPKDNISYVGVCYDIGLFDEVEEIIDIMYG